MPAPAHANDAAEPMPAANGFVRLKAIQVNISKYEQRTLHALAQGGTICVQKNDAGDIIHIDCITRDGWRLADCTLAVFRKLRRRRFVRSEDGRPYRITRDGLAAVRAQVDNR
jgi:uncharacterized protein YjhX (UPF0386 family)